MQELRSSSQALQGWQRQRAALATALALELIDTETALMPFPR
jgi:hypothetical protein